MCTVCIYQCVIITRSHPYHGPQVEVRVINFKIGKGVRHVRYEPIRGSTVAKSGGKRRYLIVSLALERE